MYRYSLFFIFIVTKYLIEIALIYKLSILITYKLSIIFKDNFENHPHIKHYLFLWIYNKMIAYIATCSLNEYDLK